MQFPIRRLLIVLFLILPMLPGTCLAYASLVVLGDSLSDVGNLRLGTQGLPGGPLPQAPPYFQGRFSNGPNYSETLWQELGLPGVIAASFAGGTNYAVGGARTRYHSFDLINPGFNPLNDPTTTPQFTLLGQRDLLLFNNGGNLNPADLYTVWIGSNDVRDAILAVAMGGPMAFANQLIAQSAADLLTVVGDLAASGAQDLLIPNVPNFGQVPEMLALAPSVPGITSLATSLSQQFNDLVDAGLTSINAEITRLDVFAILDDYIADPTQFGQPGNLITSRPCFEGFVGIPGNLCNQAEQFVFFDKIHPTSATHAILGKLAANSVPVVHTLWLMALGLIGIGIRRRNG